MRERSAMSDTPRTDAAFASGTSATMRDVSSQRERELGEAMKAAQHLDAYIDSAIAQERKP